MRLVYWTGYWNRDISPNTVALLLISFVMTTIHLYGLDPFALAEPHSKSLSHQLTIAHVCLVN